MNTDAGAKVVRTVTIVRSHYGNDGSAAPDLLGTPMRQNIPAPHSDSVMHYFRRSPPAKGPLESAANLFVHTNTQLGKRLEIYKWIAEESWPGPQNARLYDLFLLHIVDI